MYGSNLENLRKKMRMKRISMFAIFAVIVIIAIVIGSQSASFKRWWKTTQSNYGGGLERTITVYDYTGNIIETYEGRFDIETHENKVLFDDENGKRTIIYNAVVIVEEK